MKMGVHLVYSGLPRRYKTCFKLIALAVLVCSLTTLFFSVKCSRSAHCDTSYPVPNNSPKKAEGNLSHTNSSEIIRLPIDTKVQYAKHKYLNIFNASGENTTERNSIESNKCVAVETTTGMTQICIYDPMIDKWVSGTINKGELWEKNDVYTMASIFEENPDLQLLDVGCNIGVFTLHAAKMGRKVVAIDANKMNLRLLSKSLDLGELRRNVTLIWNAVSDIHEAVNLTITKGNIGGSFIQSELNAHSFSKSSYITQKVFSITLDDLIGFVEGKPLFIKIDIEGYEWKAFRGGERFFREVDVRYILMEWATYKTNKESADVIHYMSKLGYEPYKVQKPILSRLDVKCARSWPGNIIWMKI